MEEGIALDTELAELFQHYLQMTEVSHIHCIHWVQQTSESLKLACGDKQEISK